MAEAIVVKTQRIVVYPPSGKIDIYGYGPAGATGPPGPPGSGAVLAWPIVAPANTTGNITFTPANGNDIRGLQTPDAASWIRFWAGPPMAIYLKANSGPTTAGMNGAIFIDADDVNIRSSNAVGFARFTAAGHTLYGAATILSSTLTSLANLTLGPSAGQAGDEGGQLSFAGTSAWTPVIYIDRLQNTLRVVQDTTVVGGFQGSGVGFYNGTHPVQGTGFAALWRTDTSGTGNWALMQSAGGDTYINGVNNQYFRINNANVGYWNNSGFGIYGTRYMGFADYGGGFYMADTTWIRTYGSKNLYCSGEIRAGAILSCDGPIHLNAGQVMRLYASNDNNHWLTYSSVTPTGSGVGSNGPELRGYSTVWLHTISNESHLFLYGQNTFITAAGSYLKFSSRELKKNIESLDPEACLSLVGLWRPVAFDFINSEGLLPNQMRSAGFIAEELAEVSPDLCSIMGPDTERPGWANAVGLAETTPYLTGSVQALLARIELLEQRINNMEAA